MNNGFTYDILRKAVELLESSEVELSDDLSYEEILQLQKEHLLKTEVEQNIEAIVKRGVLKAYNRYMRVK